MPDTGSMGQGAGMTERRAIHDSMLACNISIDPLNTPDGATAIMALAGRPNGVHLCNAYTLALASKDSSYLEALNRGDLNLPDGMPLVWTARKLGFDLKGRAYGPSVMAEVMDRGRATGMRHFLYGSTPEVLKDLETNIEDLWPGTIVAGSYSPPFKALDENEKAGIVDRIKSTQPDIVWVGLGTPKQDFFVDEYRDLLGATLVAIGAAFDFHAGQKSQPPSWIQNIGMEWAWRFASEPGRLWKRYVFGNTRFVWTLLQKGGPKRIPADTST